MTTPAVISAVNQGATNVRQIDPSLPTLPPQAVDAIIKLLKEHPPKSDEALAVLTSAAAQANLGPQQIATMQLILKEPTVFNANTPEQRAAMGAVYALLLGAGGYTVLNETKPNADRSPAALAASRQRMQLVLSTAAAVYFGGRYTNHDFGQRERQERLRVFVSMWSSNLRDLAKGREINSAMAEQALWMTRSALLDGQEAQHPSPAIFADASQITYRPEQAPLTGAAMPRAAVGPRPAGDAASYAAAMPQGQLQVAPRTTRIVPIDEVHARQGTMMPDGQTPWTPENAARALASTTNFKERIALLTGLTLRDRQLIAEAYAHLRDGGKGYVGGDALGFMIQDLAQSANASDAKIYTDMLRPDNREGFVSDHVMIYLDATGGGLLSSLLGIGGANDKAIERVLVHRTPQQIDIIDKNMQSTYGMSLDQVIDKIDDAETRERLRFYRHCTVRDATGAIPEGEINAWKLREYMKNFTTWQRLKNVSQATAVTDWNGIFRTLATMDNWQMREAAHAYSRQILAEGGRPDGNDGMPDPVTNQLPELNDSALGRALIAQSQEAIRLGGGKDLARLRTEIAIHGLAARMPPPPIGYPGETAAHYQQRVAQYRQLQAQWPDLAKAHAANVQRFISVSLQLASDKELSTADVQGTLSLIQANVGDGQTLPNNGLPLPQDVILQWQHDTHNKSDNPDVVLDDAVRAANASVASRDEERNTRFYFAGLGENSPALRGAKLVTTLAGPMHGFLGPFHLQTQDLLNLSDIPGDQRDAYLQQMYAAYAAATKTDAKPGGRNLYQDVVARCGADSLEARLAQRGIASNAERIYTALHARTLFGLAETDNLPRVSAIVDKMSPLERIITRMEYKRKYGRDLLDELKAAPELDARIAGLSLRVSPADVPMVAAEAQMYFGATVNNPALAAKRAQALGRDPGAVNDFFLRNLYDYETPQPNAQGQVAPSPTVSAIADAINGRGGAMGFARSVADSADDVNQAVRAATDDAVGNALMRGVQSLVSNDGKTLTIQGEKVQRLSQRAQDELKRLGYVTGETQAEMVATVVDLKERARKAGVDIHKATELVANLAVTAAIITTSAVAPGLGALWVAAISGATGVATRAALGQVRSVKGGVLDFIADAAKGLAAANTISVMNAVYNTPGVTALDVGLGGAGAGAQQGATIALGEVPRDPMLRYDTAQGFVNDRDMYLAFMGRDAIVGGLTAELFGYLSGQFDKKTTTQQQPTQTTNQPSTTNQPTQPTSSTNVVRPTNGDRPVSGPGTTNPTNPTNPTRPVDPNRPTNPTNPTQPITAPPASRPGGSLTPPAAPGGGTTQPVLGRPGGTTHLPTINNAGVNGRPGSFGTGPAAQPTAPVVSAPTAPARPGPTTTNPPSRTGDVGANPVTATVSQPATPVAAPVAGVGVRPVGSGGSVQGNLVPGRGGAQLGGAPTVSPVPATSTPPPQPLTAASPAPAATATATPPPAATATVSPAPGVAANTTRPTGIAGVASSAPVAGASRSTRQIVITNDQDLQDATEMVRQATARPGLPASRPTPAVSTSTMPLGTQRAFDIAYNSDPVATLDAATLTWGAVAVSSAVTLASMETPQQHAATLALRDSIERQMPGVTDKTHEFLERMSADERRTAVRGFSGTFAAAALAYANKNGGILPGVEGDDNRFNRLLDMAYRNSGAAVPGGNPSRIEKVYAILAAADGVPVSQIGTATGVVPTRRGAPQVSPPPAPAPGPASRAARAPVVSAPRHAATTAARTPVPGPAPAAAAVPAPETADTLVTAINGDITAVRAQQGAGDPALYERIAANLNKLNSMNGRSQQQVDAAIAAYADLVRQPGDNRATDRQGRLTAIVAKTQPYPAVLSATFVQLQQGNGAITPGEKVQLAVDAAAPLFKRPGVIDPYSLPLTVTSALDHVSGQVQGVSQETAASYQAAGPAMHMMGIVAQLNEDNPGARRAILRNETEWMVTHSDWLLATGFHRIMFAAFASINQLPSANAPSPADAAQARLEVADRFVHVINSGRPDLAAMTLQALAQEDPGLARDLVTTIWSPPVESKMTNGLLDAAKYNFAVDLAISQLPTEAGKIGHPRYTPADAAQHVHPLLQLLTTTKEGRDALFAMRDRGVGVWASDQERIKGQIGRTMSDVVRPYLDELRTAPNTVQFPITKKVMPLSLRMLIIGKGLPFASPNPTEAEAQAEAAEAQAQGAQPAPSR